ncbi:MULTISPECIES: Imm9 family immunity protein [Acinetobacter]|uniref:Uncharacterized protein n=2 Tax=Acinetobacter TaxID=469 RepID=N9T5F6_9GAMM|nr:MULTISPECIES: Imm9 family immunity protein [Acinetobacter]ENX58605.1 hypothetical protein F902_03006 [Acinetobacter higginsii]
MHNYPKIRVLSYIGVMKLNDVVDINAIEALANKYIETLTPSINTEDLGEWRLLMYLVFNHGDVIGLGKCCVTYPSDKEKSWSIGIPVPDLKQAAYGLEEKHFVRTSVDRRAEFHDPVNAKFADYSDLQTCLATNVIRGLEAAFLRGVTIAGKRIKLIRPV